MATLIAPVISHQGQIEAANKALQDARSQFSQNALRLPSDQLSHELDSVRKLELAAQAQQSLLDIRWLPCSRKTSRAGKKSRNSDRP